MEKTVSTNRKIPLEEIGAFLSKLAEKSTSVYWLSSPDLKKIQYLSPAYDEIWGRPRELLYASPELWITYLHPEDAKKKHPIHALAGRIAHLGEAARYEENYRIVRPDGEIRWIIDRGFPIFDTEGNCCGVTGVAIDVTKEKLAEEELRKAKERAEAADKAKTEFLMNMRHDIRTPLSGIIGFAHLIKEEAKTGNLAEYADNMLASGQALLDLLNEILEAIRIASGEVPLLCKGFDLKEKIASIIALNQSKAKQKHLNLSFDYDPRIPKCLWGDAKRIHRILLELVCNALNFTHQGEIKITAELVKQVDYDVMIKITVKDTGIGIPPDKLEDIFVRFKRLTPSYQGVYKGLGIGLMIVKQFIDDMDAEIHIDSEIDQGSTFTCLFGLKTALPNNDEEIDHTIKPPDQPESQTLSAELKTAESVNSDTDLDIRILIVEDSYIAAVVTNKLLTTLGCQVDMVMNGQSALDQTKIKTYDGIFMDVGLPDIKGDDATRAFRAWEANLAEDRHTPIIALTAHVETEEKQNCIAAGMDAVLCKPLTREKAIDILSAFIPKYCTHTHKTSPE